MKKTILKEQINTFEKRLKEDEHACGTVKKYRRDVEHLAKWLGNRPLTREAVSAWKERLLVENYAPVTVNSMIAAVNRFLKIQGRDDCCVRALRIQRKLFRPASRELSRAEFIRLVSAAEQKGKHRLALLMEAVCGTGIRVGEVRYLTIEAVRTGCVEIAQKGKIRTILLPGKLRKKLLRYGKQQKITAGTLFVTSSGKPLGRKQIWAEMKSLCADAGVSESKVFPHNLRHLFARSFYQAYHDLAKLADVLGHSSMETTRLYLISTGEEHRNMLDRICLLL